MHVLIVTRNHELLGNGRPARLNGLRVWTRTPGHLKPGLIGVALDHVIYDVPEHELSEEDKITIRCCLRSRRAA